MKIENYKNSNETTFHKEYAKLNKEQQAAVDTIEGPVMVIAGPGTGKTQILAMRIANILLKTQINPTNILCLTFTNSGVHAMKQRLLQIIGPASYQVHVHTFHQFCNEVIETFPEKFLTARGLNQLTDLEQIELIQNILTKSNLSHIKPFKSPFHYQAAILDAINKLKQEDISPDNFIKHIKTELNNFEKIPDLLHDKGPYKGKMKSAYAEQKEQLLKNKELAQVYQEYKNHLREKGLYDFADMVLFVVSAFKSDPDLLAHFQEKFQYILVDEYQDTNSAQNEVIELLASFYETPNIFVVGDDEQSIYRFQGASLENILFFKNRYPSTKIIVLEHNYRSVQNILDASRALITHNQNQIYTHLKISKNLKSQLKNLKGGLHVGEFSNGSIENFFVAKQIQKLIKQGAKPSQIAVLYKEHRDSEELIDFLSKLNIPYRLEIGDNVLLDPEINKILRYFQALDLNEKANELLFEIMHYPFFGISPLDIYKINFAAKNHKVPLFDILVNPKKYALDLENEEAVFEFYASFMACRQLCYNLKFDDAFSKIVEKTGFLNYLLSLKDSVRHFNRLQTFYKYLQKVNLKSKGMKLKDFLEHIRLLNENNIVIKEDELTAEYEGVNLMTAHKSKGLEFSHVFIIRAIDKHWGNKSRRELIKLPSNLIKNCLPRAVPTRSFMQRVEAPKVRSGENSSKSTDLDEEDLSSVALAEEERRLFYVSLTRAKQSLYITYALSYGEAEDQTFAIPSQFILEIPPQYLQKIDTSPYEKSFDERLKITFGSVKWEYTQAMHEFLKTLITDFYLSPTALNTYLECPQKFLFDNILRVPKAKDFTQSYGTAVHLALERFFKDFIRDLTVPPKEKLLAYFEEALRYEIMTEEDYNRARQNGADILTQYYYFYLNSWKQKGIPLSCEMNFKPHSVHFGNIPITGKIDKIELIDKNAKTVRIIDYKTAAPKSLNQLLGKTKAADTDYLYQIYFYKLLCENDPLFNWRVGEIVFDFISPAGSSDNTKFKQVAVPVEPKEYDNFKQILKDSYKKIVALEFPHNSQTCKKKEGECPYFAICHVNISEKEKIISKKNRKPSPNLPLPL